MTPMRREVGEALQILDQRVAKTLTRPAMPREDIALHRTKLGSDAFITALTSKSVEYNREATYRRSHAFFVAAAGGSVRGLAHILQRISKITIKPDGIVLDTFNALNKFMEANGYELIHFEIEKLTSAAAREIWRYQWNVATLDRMQVFDEILSLSDSIALYFRDCLTNQRLTGSVRLRTLKGSAVTSERDGTTLRDAIAAPNRVMTLVHAADEPIDIIREVGVLHPTAGLEYFEQLLHDLQNTRDRHSIIQNARLAYERIRSQLTEKQESWADFESSECETQAIRELKPTGHSYFTYRTENQQECDQPKGQAWAEAKAASETILHDLHGESCFIDGDGVYEWLSGVGMKSDESQYVEPNEEGQK